jgi:flagellar FliJ protein
MRAQEERLDELHRYHREYLDRFHASASSGMSATQLQEYRAFLSKLERAIQEQESVVAESRSECSVNQENWQQKHVRTQALGKVMERYQKEEQKQQDVREQKEADERNQRGKR